VAPGAEYDDFGQCFISHQRPRKAYALP
jgi:hypothetical protein